MIDFRRPAREDQGVNRLLATLLVLAATAVAASSAGAATDPRKCNLSRSTAFETQQVCAKSAAVIALKRYMARRTPGWNAQVTCAGTSPKWLAWTCALTNANGTGGAKITFRALSNGWHTSVVVSGTA